MISNSSDQLSTISIDRIIEMAWEDKQFHRKTLDFLRLLYQDKR